MTTTKLEGYDVDENDFTTSNDLATCQWINPQKDHFGLAISPVNAAKAMFDPAAAGWEPKEIKFPKKTEILWMTRNPRIIVLNGSKVISAERKDDGDACPRYMWALKPKFDDEGRPIFDSNKKQEVETLGVIPYDASKLADKEHYTSFSRFVFLVVDGNNQVVSNPIVLRVQKASELTIVNLFYDKFIPQLLEVYEEAVEKKLPKETPTCKFLSRFVFQPILTEGKAGGDNKSAATRADSFVTLTAKRFTEFALQSKTHAETIATIASHLENLLDYVSEPLMVMPSESEPVEVEAVAPTPVEAAPKSAPGEETYLSGDDIRELMGEILRLETELGLSSEGIRTLLLDNFSKGVKHLLTTDELLSYLELLKTREMRELMGEIRRLETEYSVSPRESKEILISNFAKGVKHLLTTGELRSYLEILKKMEMDEI